MPTSLDKALAAIAISTFEGLGFLLATEDEGEGRREPFEGLTARVDFRGASSGCLELRLSADVLEELAGNMLAIECDPPRDLQLDALGEVANVLIGNFMPVLGGGVQMGTPRVEDRWTPPIGEPMAHTRLSVECGKADVVVYVEAAR